MTTDFLQNLHTGAGIAVLYVEDSVVMKVSY